MASVSNPNLGDAESDLVARLVDEYKILQDKIDKIGAFRFTIKGWSITVIIASIFAGSTTKEVPRWFWAISLIVFLIVFFLYERQQTNLSYRFGRRVLAIEDVLSRLLRNRAHASQNTFVASSFLSLHFVPGIGHLGGRTGKKRGSSRNFLRTCIEADLVFYLVQVAVVVVAFVFGSGGAPPKDQTTPESIIINNGPATPERPEHFQPAQTDSGQKQSLTAIGKNEKPDKNKKELASH
jgi:hypothetical protein